MTPQEAAEQYANEASEDLQKAFLTLGYEPETVAEREYWKSAFKAGYTKANNIHDQALSSALKEIAELHAKLHEMSEYITKVQSKNDDLEFANSELHAKVNWLLRSIDELEDDYTDLEDSCIRLKSEVIKLQNADRLSPESTRQPDSANLPPEVTT